MALPMRVCLIWWVAFTAAGATAPATSGPFSFEMLRQRALALAAAEYRPEESKLPEALKKLTYDEYQTIRFRAEAGPWRQDDPRFTFQFFHPGFLYQDAVKIHLVEDGQVRDYRFTPAQFDYGSVRFPKPLPPDLPFAGLRILYPVNRTGKQDEVASFLGASYFRLLGKGQRYGASARGLAIDTAEPTGEEFPRFTEFWVEKPARTADAVEFYALLESAKVTGAYRFVLKPGVETVLEVEAYVQLRKDVRKLGLGALTSMYLFGGNRTRFFSDFRPEVHDSDCLLFEASSGEWQVRPLINPEKTFQVSQFAADTPKGFGVLQRHREFCQYEDLGARYDLRPNLWVKPGQAWTAGTLELVEIPTPGEFSDNIVCYWVPKEKATAGKQFHLRYTVTASLYGPSSSPPLKVHSTFLDPPTGKELPRFLVDFDTAQDTARQPAGAVAAKVNASRGQIKNLVVHTNDVKGGWRVFFDLAAPGEEKVDLRAVLHAGDTAVSEVWVYRWQP